MRGRSLGKDRDTSWWDVRSPAYAGRNAFPGSDSELDFDATRRLAEAFERFDAMCAPAAKEVRRVKEAYEHVVGSPHFRDVFGVRYYELEHGVRASFQYIDAYAALKKEYLSNG